MSSNLVVLVIDPVYRPLVIYYYIVVRAHILSNPLVMRIDIVATSLMEMGFSD